MSLTPTELVLKHYKLPFTMRQFQIATVNALAPLDRSAAFLDVGTGKTVVSTMIGLYKALLGEVNQFIILMPPIILLQWQDWLTEIGVESLVYKGPPAQRKAMSLDHDVILMTFNILKNDHARIMETFEHRKTLIIIDEAAAIRRPQTQTFAAVQDLLRSPGKQLVMLTGTAIGRLHHAFGYIKLKTPEIYKDYSTFLMRHVSEVSKYDEPMTFRNVDELKENLMLKAVKVDSAEVLDLPDVVYSSVPYDLSPPHKKLYKKLLEEKLIELDDGTILDGTKEQAMYNLAQRIILTPAVYGGEAIVPEAFSLIDTMIAEMSATDKLIIYANYRASNEAIAEYVSKQQVKAIQAYGALGADRNLKNVGLFLKDPSVRILIANPGSIGIGLNLQSVCRLELFMELPLTSNVFTQAVGRIVREGQTKPCLIKFVIARGTIQAYLKRAIVQKEDEIQKVMPSVQTLRKALYGDRE